MYKEKIIRRCEIRLDKEAPFVVSAKRGSQINGQMISCQTILLSSDHPKVWIASNYPNFIIDLRNLEFNFLKYSSLYPQYSTVFSVPIARAPYPLQRFLPITSPHKSQNAPYASQNYPNTPWQALLTL